MVGTSKRTMEITTMSCPLCMKNSHRSIGGTSCKDITVTVTVPKIRISKYHNRVCFAGAGPPYLVKHAVRTAALCSEINTGS